MSPPYVNENTVSVIQRLNESLSMNCLNSSVSSFRTAVMTRASAMPQMKLAIQLSFVFTSATLAQLIELRCVLNSGHFPARRYVPSHSFGVLYCLQASASWNTISFAVRTSRILSVVRTMPLPISNTPTCSLPA
jgi:hypothetical protein